MPPHGGGPPQSPAQVPLWEAALDGEPGWAAIYDGYGSAVDWPTAGFFRELKDAFPEGLGTDALMERFVAHNEVVRETIPDDRLLVFRVTEGWGPLCEFVGAEVPGKPFRAPTTGPSSGSSWKQGSRAS